MRLLIAYDASPCADAAIDDLVRAGLPQDGQALILTVADVWLAEQPGPDVAAPSTEHVEAAIVRMRQEAQREVERCRGEAESGARRLGALFPSWTVEARAVADSPAWGILRIAEEWRPDLIVAGSQGRNAVARWILGSVSSKVLAEARCSVRIARGRVNPEDQPIRVLIGFDGSSGAASAVRAVADRTWPPGTEARLVAAVPGGMQPPSSLFPAPDAYDPSSWLGTALAGSARELEAAGLKVSTMFKNEDPKKALLAEAGSWGADVIFVGARGLRRIERFMIGSVSQAVANAARCTVEVVREPSPAATS